MQAAAARRRHRPRRRAWSPWRWRRGACRPTKFSPPSVTGFRIAVFPRLAALVALWFVRPLRRRVTDMQVALYVEEHEPSLQAAILSAVDIGAHRLGDAPDVPRVILDRLVDQAVEKCRTIQGGQDHRPHVGAPPRRRRWARSRSSASLLLVVGPEFLRQGASALLVLSTQRRSGQPVRDQGQARRRDGAEGLRSVDHARSSPGSGPTTSR